MLLNPLTLHNPKTAVEAARLFKELPEVKILAGGTFLLNSLKLFKHKGNKTVKNVLSLAQVEELKGLSGDKKSLTIRAMTTITDLFESPLLTDNCQIIRGVCQNISTTPIRNMATVGGNLTCRYTWTELPVVLMALDALMYFMTADGTSVEVSTQDFFKNNARSENLFTHAVIPVDPQARLAYRRVRKMSEVDQPLLTVCIKTAPHKRQWSKTRAVVNNGTAFAQRDYQLEEFLNGKTSSPTLGQEAMHHLTADIYDTRSNEYKQHMFRVCLRGAIEEICRSN